ncbi:MAG: repair protein RecO [Chloroflexota bacterium]|nr:repair protein RecO [Chloroflexota bacterium]
MQASDHIRKVEALVIAHKEYGEADRFVRLFSLQNGKLNTLAKGVRKMQSRKAAHLEPFTHAALVLARGHTFWIITQAETVNAFPAIREDLDKTTDASYIMELVDKISTEGQAEPSLFRLALETMGRINDNADTYNCMRYFELRFLDITGFRPELQNCVACKKEIQAEDQYFSPLQGGILCPQCGRMDNTAIAANVDTLRYLRHFQRSNYRSVENLEIPPRVRPALQRVLGQYIASVVEWQLNTPAFQQQIREQGKRPD